MRSFLGPAANQPERSFLDDVLEGLALEQPTLRPKYFYDETGSELFEQICDLEDYYPTRTELAIMQAHVGEMAQALGENVLVVEFGSGASVKTRLLLDALQAPAAYVPVDISGDFLLATAETLRRDYPHLEVHPVAADFTRAFDVPLFNASRIAVYFPGSTIGNFTPDRALALLTSIRGFVGEKGAALIGADLVKDPEVLVAAYDDSKGITAAFNKNVFARINRELGGDFNVEGFKHRARYDQDADRIEMWLDSTVAQTVTVAGQRFGFEVGDSILTEYSHKYTQPRFDELAAKAGFAETRTWTDPQSQFSVQLVTAG